MALQGMQNIFGSQDLFPGDRDLTIRYEEQTDQPTLSSQEIVLWHMAGGVNERLTATTGANLTVDAANDRVGQSFTIGYTGAKVDFVMTGITFKLFRVLSPGTITCNLYYADPADGKPTGASLASGTYDGDTLTTDTAGADVLFSFGTSFTVLNGVRYACVLNAPSADASNYFTARANGAAAYGAATFPGEIEQGFGLTSDDAESTWSRPSGWDLYFKVHGDGDVMLVNLFGTIKQIPLFDIS